MKKVIFTMMVAILPFLAMAASKDIKWKKVEASELNLLGKAFDTPNPYHRIDTGAYKGFTEKENKECRMSAGIMVLFRTDASRIGVSVKFGDVRAKTPFASYNGFDLYIKKDGKWTWAGMTMFDYYWDRPNNVNEIVTGMAQGQKECLLYLPLQAELLQCQLCVPEGCTLEPLESDFRHKIVFHGSSFTQGSGCTRGGMTYPMQFMRRTGLYGVSLGFGGRCKMQPYFADVLEDIDADAYILDPFSNSTRDEVHERLETFISRLVTAHPGKPIIVQRTIQIGNENFSGWSVREMPLRRALADELMPQICKRYKDVYYIRPSVLDPTGECTTSDGIHPNDMGYTIWEQSIEKPVLEILAKYGIR